MKTLLLTTVMFFVAVSLNAQKLTKVTFMFKTTGDNLDHDSDVKMEIYRFDPHKVYATGILKGGDSGGTIEKSLRIVSDITKDKLNGKHSYIEIIPNGNDKWKADCIIHFEFDDGTSESFTPGDIELGNHDGWGHYRDNVIKF